MAFFKDREIRLDALRGEVSVKRNNHGIPVIRAENHHDLLFGLGWVHVRDRMVAMELTRLCARGEISEYIAPDPEYINLDIAMRQYNLRGDSVSEVKRLDPETRDLVLAYCSGVNRAMSGSRRPLEFMLAGHRPAPWTPADCIMILKLMGFVDMTETQGWLEKLIIQMFQKGVPPERIKELFPAMGEDPSPEYLEILRRVRLAGPIIPETVNWQVVPRLQCSNNWALSGKRTASGLPILCGDPHVDTARLPSIWHEVILEGEGSYFTGALAPGLPLPTLGRTRDLSWSPTYGYMDVMDYFIEEVRGGKYRRGDRWVPFSVREETVRVKNDRPFTAKYYENDIGVLEGDPGEDGYHLCLAWTAGRNCGSETMNNMIGILRSSTVAGAMKHFAGLGFAAFNWVMADRQGNIGYQMSGRSPVRAPGSSGLLPLPAWDEQFHWRGYHEGAKNPSACNPEEQYIVTANNDLNHYGEVPVINLPMAGYRALRVAEMIGFGDSHTVETMKPVQNDVFSKQAEALMPVIRPFLPAGDKGNLLREWDLRYDSGSRAATLFESIYLELVGAVFGDNGLGREVMDCLTTGTILFQEFYGIFDRVLLAGESLWLSGRSREEIFALAVERGLKAEARPYGSTHRLVLKNLFFRGMLPGFLGFDYGPVELPGGRATIRQGKIFARSGDRVTAVAPAYRFITDMAEDRIYSASAGGPSGSRFSKWYTSGLRDWLEGRYRVTEPLKENGYRL